MQVKIWNKTDLINDCRPNVIMEAYPFSKTRDMLLFVTGEVVNQVADIRQVKAILFENNVDYSKMSMVQMGEKYLQITSGAEEENSLQNQINDINCMLTELSEEVIYNGRI